MVLATQDRPAIIFFHACHTTSWEMMRGEHDGQLVSRCPKLGSEADALHYLLYYCGVWRILVRAKEEVLEAGDSLEFGT